jgi:SARP family transcriptional regulator, regulator of embCAB operon
MKIRILGPLCVINGSAEVTPTAPKQRQVLVLLLLNANRVVATSQLIRELWAHDPPASAVAAVHTCVMELRRSLGTAASRLVTWGRGYRMNVWSGELDLEVGTGQLDLARDALTNDNLPAAAEEFHAALEDWQPVLVDVAAGPIVTPAMTHIASERLRAVKQRIDVDLRLGLHHPLIGELRALVHEYPTDEELVSDLMLVLYRCGRRADALDVLQILRTKLAKEYHVRLPPSLLALHVDMLRADPRLDVAPSPGSRLSLDLTDIRPARRAVQQGKNRSVAAISST